MLSRRLIFSRIAAAYLVLLVAAPHAWAPQPPSVPLSAPLALDPAIRTGTLPNGLKYFIRQNGRPEKRVSLRLAVQAGSIDETEEQRGLAHFLEHMAFNGTKNFKAGELVTFLESIGARFGAHANAYTSFDETVYMLDVPTDREGFLDRGMTALADFAGGMTLDPKEIDRERGVVIEEWRSRRGAAARVQDLQMPAIYGKSKYTERSPIGLPEVLKSFKPETLRAFYERWYRPDRMAVVVVGDVSHADVLPILQKHFGALKRPAAAAPPRTYPIPLTPETRVVVATDREIQQSSVMVMYKRPLSSERTVGDYRRSLVEGLAFQMLNARLAEISRQPEAPFLGASSGGDVLGRTVQASVMSARAADGKIAEGLTALGQEAARIRQHGFGPAELDRAKKATLAAYERMYNERTTSESPGLAAELIRHFLEGEPVPGIAAEYEMARQFVPGMTTEETAAAARRLLESRTQAVLVTAPEKTGQPAPTEAALRSALSKGEDAPVAAWRDDMGGRELMAKRPEPGTVKAKREIAELGVTVLTLSNGVEVWLKPTDYKNDQVLFTAYARGGLSLASPQEYQEADLATALVDLAGVGGFTPVELDKLLSGKLASANPYIADYTHGVSGSSTPKDLETAMQLMFLSFTAPNRTAESFALLQKRLQAALVNRDQNPQAVFGERLSEINTSGHYSAKPLKVEDLQNLRPERMLSFYDARFSNAADFTFFFAGTFSVDQITPLVERYIGGLPSKGAAASKIGTMRVQFPAAPVRETVRKGQEPKSQTVMSYFAETGLGEFEMHRLRAAMSVMEMRLRELLREELGGTYGVGVGYSNTQPVPGYEVVQVSYGSAPDNVETMVAAVQTEMDRMRAAPPTEEEIQKVKELERRDLETAVRTNGYWTGSLQTVHMFGWDPLSIARRAARTQSLTPANVHEQFTKAVSTTRRTVVTLLPEK